MLRRPVPLRAPRSPRRDAQTYAPPAIIECLDRCSAAPDACFLVAERSHDVVGFLHFDAFGPEPELHRLYVDRRHRGVGVGVLLMDELHARMPSDLAYMLLVVAGNDGAVRFHRRHGLRVERIVGGLAYYTSAWASGSQPMRRRSTWC